MLILFTCIIIVYKPKVDPKMSESTISQTARKAMKDAFRSFDTDKSGFIEPHELSMLLRKLTDSFHVMHPSDDEIIEVFR